MAGETEAGRCDPGARFTPLPGEVEGHAFPDCYPARVLSQGERQLGLVCPSRALANPLVRSRPGAQSDASSFALLFIFPFTVFPCGGSGSLSACSGFL